MIRSPTDASLVKDFTAPVPLGPLPEPAVTRLALPCAAGLVPVPTRPGQVWPSLRLIGLEMFRGGYSKFVLDCTYKDKVNHQTFSLILIELIGKWIIDHLKQVYNYSAENHFVIGLPSSGIYCNSDG